MDLEILFIVVSVCGLVALILLFMLLMCAIEVEEKAKESPIFKAYKIGKGEWE